MTLSAWIDPTDDDVRTESGGRVTEITDKSPEGNDVIEGVALTGPPTALINDLTVLDFSAAGDWLRRLTGSVSGMDAGDITVIAAYTDDGTSGGRRGITSRSTGVGPFNDGWILGKPLNETNIAFDVEGSNSGNEVAGGATVNNIDIVVGRFDDVNNFAEIIKNGGELFEGITRSQTSVAGNSFVIGDGDSSGVYGWQSGNIGDVIVWAGVMRYDQIQRVEGYLAHKFDSLNSLPAGHPFKVNAPDIVVDADVIANFQGDHLDTTYTAETGQALTPFGSSRLNSARDKKFGRTIFESFDEGGVGSYLTVGTEADLTNVFTVEGWFLFDDVTQTDYPLIAKWDFNSSDRSYILNFNTTGTDSLDFALDTGSGNGTTTVAVNAEGWTPVLGQWYHIAATCDGINLRLFIDGVLQDTTPNTLAPNTTTNTRLGIGGFGLDSGAAADGHDGGIGPIRIIRDRCLYVSDFVPPVRQFRLPVKADLIANFNGQSTTFTSEDETGRVATFVGNAQLNSAERKFGYSSLLLDGTGDYLTFPDDADFEYADGDFTLEAFVNPDNTNRGTVLAKWNTGTNQTSFIFSINAGGGLQFDWSTTGTGTSGTATGAFTFVAGTWYHIVAMRKGPTIMLFVDGVLVDTQDIGTDSLFDSTVPLEVGSTTTGGGRVFDLDGNVDAVRTAKAALYAPVVEPEEQPEAGSDDDLLLLFESGTNSDDAGAVPFTLEGGASLVNTQGQLGTNCLDANASNRAINIAAGNAPRLNDTDFTVEVIVRPVSFGVSYDAILDERATTTDGDAYYLGIQNSGGNRQFVVYINGTNFLFSGLEPFPADVWYHVVWMRRNGVSYLLVNGEIKDSAPDTTNYDGGIDLSVGERNSHNPGGGFRGYVDLVRIRTNDDLYPFSFPRPVAGMGEPIT